MAKSLTTYSSLIKKINTTMQQGLLAAQRALDRERLKTYWAIGRDICHIADQSQGEIVCGRDLYKKMSKDLHQENGFNLSWDTLQRIVKFYRTYSQCPQKSSLTFSHYRVLSRVIDKKERLKFERQADKENLSVPALIDIVKLSRVKVSPAVHKNKKPLPCRRGEPYVYKIENLKNIDGASESRIDCGFYINVPFGNNILEAATSLKTDSACIRVYKEGGVYRVAKERQGAAKRFTYLARVLKVVDGDTLDVAIDVGFGILMKERLRLKGINAPEKDSPEGKLTMKYLKHLFSKNAFIVIRSSKEGVYKRWIADVFFKEDSQDPHVIATEGVFLNQHLLDEGLAAKY